MTVARVRRARLRPALGLAFALVATSVVTCRPALAGPADAASEFLRSVQRGDRERAKSLLDDAEFRVTPSRGGDDGYFVYESAYEPNLAFLVGRAFAVGPPAVSTERSDWYVLDGTLYATAVFALRFTADRYQPWVLPPALAFGRPMRVAEVMSFVAAPARQPEGLTLRIRAGLQRGLIRPPASAFVVPPPPAPPGASTSTVRADRAGGFGSLFGPTPMDPGAVVLPSGETLSIEQLGRLLPRLTAMTFHVQLVRRGRLASWAVSRWEVADAAVLADGRQTVIRLGNVGTLRSQ